MSFFQRQFAPKLSMVILFLMACGCAGTGKSLLNEPQELTSSASGASEHGGSAPHAPIIRRGSPAPGFLFTDHHGNLFTKDHLQGKWTVLLFGYTHCPDFCPTTLTALSDAYRHLEQKYPGVATRLQVVFVSVDPFRDTTPILASYIAYFNAGFIAASGTPSELYRFTRMLGVDYSYADINSGIATSTTKQQPASDYAVNHSSDVFIFDDRAHLVTSLTPPHSAPQFVTIIRNLMQDAESAKRATSSNNRPDGR